MSILELRGLSACASAISYVSEAKHGADALWATTDRAKWMAWLLVRTGTPPSEVLKQLWTSKRWKELHEANVCEGDLDEFGSIYDDELPYVLECRALRAVSLANVLDEYVETVCDSWFSQMELADTLREKWPKWPKIPEE